MPRHNIRAEVKSREAENAASVIKAKQRKRKNRQETEQTYAYEAKMLGITVEQLKLKKFQETLKIIKNPPSLPSEYRHCR
ncbi:MAG: hypothetical protein AAB503_00930 [Patescibacteria group bacterium]